MSFILEALKKSEQQRQQKNVTQKVRKRTLSLSSRQSARWPYWLVGGLLPLAVLSGLWLYNQPEAPLDRSIAVNQPTNAPAALSQPEVAEPKVATPSASVSQPSAAATDPAPVPRDVVSSPPVLANKASAKSYEPAAKPRRIDATTAKQTIKVDEQAATVVIKQSQPQNIDEMPSGPTSVQLPLYLDLSRELRDRMPRLAMSMHFYTNTPSRRLVRINNHLLHEGDWLGSDLQIVEITATGATLDSLGKLFEMRGPGR